MKTFGDGLLDWPCANLYSMTENRGTNPLCKHYQIDLILSIAITNG